MTEPDGPDPTDGEPGPRLARTLAEQADAKAARRRRTIGIAVVIVGLVVVGFAAWSMVGSSDDDAERDVGKLTASHIAGDDETNVASANVTKTTAKGGGAKGGSTTTVPKGTKAKHWPAVMFGRPPAFGKIDDEPAGAGDLADGYYLWNDFDGFHLWLVGGGDGDAVTLTIDDPMTATAVGGPVDLAKTPNSFTLKRGSADGEVVGVDFGTGFYGKNLIVSVDGDLPLHLGSRAKLAPSYYGARYEAS